MGLVVTSRPCVFAAPLAAPARLPTVAKWKVVKKKVKLRPRKVRGCAADRFYRKACKGPCWKVWRDLAVLPQKGECAKKHVGCTTHPELPPPPPQYTVIQVPYLAWSKHKRLCLFSLGRRWVACLLIHVD